MAAPGRGRTTHLSSVYSTRPFHQPIAPTAQASAADDHPNHAGSGSKNHGSAKGTWNRLLRPSNESPSNDDSVASSASVTAQHQSQAQNAGTYLRTFPALGEVVAIAPSVATVGLVDIRSCPQIVMGDSPSKRLFAGPHERHDPAIGGRPVSDHFRAPRSEVDSRGASP